MKTFERYFVALNKWALVLLLGAMAVIVFANVSLRYLTNFSITWSEEVARYLMIWMTFIGAGLALRTGGHVAVGNFQEMLGPNGQRAIRVLILCLLLAFFSIMIWMGLNYMDRARFQLTPATRVSFSYIYAAMPIGFGLLIVHLLLVARSFVMENRFAEVETDTPSAALAESGETHIAANRE
ncbi:TRAP transporter small permease [Nitratireductor rhodophyticola]|uniref:TRAP transporter small permease n=1 Tax=Nitratireductor rhodophyticola TaxID=2854036 RepID=UPI002AC8A57E|nr:TRAP transporter small permease [Nitratireductor rhodophyticola]WPZ15870.1 TRAP transporter small permease [Nitratireductor rhodophyticola]